MLSSLDGAPDMPAAGHHFVTSSLALVALGGSDLTGGFRLRTLSFDKPHNNHETHFEYGCRIPRCRGRVVRGVRMMHKLIFTVPFYHAYGAQPLCLLGYYTVGL
jgi:hypothetical protein